MAGGVVGCGAVAARPVGGAVGSGAADGGTVGGWQCGGLAARSVAVQRMAARLVAHAAVITAAAAVVRALAVLHALKGQWPPARGRNGSRIAMCRAHSHAVPQTHIDQHQQHSLR